MRIKDLNLIGNLLFLPKLFLCVSHLVFGICTTSVFHAVHGENWYTSRSGKTFKIFWLRTLSIILGMRIERNGEFLNVPLVIVSNHISWLDIVAIGSLQPIVFIARKDMGSWPIIGFLAKKSGTLFVDRQNKRDVPDVIRQAKATLEMGVPIIFFPETTTSDGTAIRCFRPSLYQISVESNSMTQSVSLRYPDTNGKASCAPYINDDVFFDHFLKVLCTHKIDVSLSVTQPIEHNSELDRKKLAKITQKQVMDMLGVGVKPEEIC